MKNNLLSHNTILGSVQNTPKSHHYNWVPQHSSQYFMSTDNEMSIRPPHPEQCNMEPMPMTPQQFDEVFQARQQQIHEQHLILNAKIQSQTTM